MNDLPTLLVNDAEGVRTITLNRGARRNALDTALATTLLEALRAADMTVLAESARLSWPEVPHGMVPSLMLPHLQHRSTRKAAFELLTLGQPVDARAALALGLANRVVADHELLEAATQLSRTHAALPRAALRDTKRLFASCRPAPSRRVAKEAIRTRDEPFGDDLIRR